jgi:hypothetical protein
MNEGEKSLGERHVNQMGSHISVHFSPFFAYYKFILIFFHLVNITLRKKQVHITKSVVIGQCESIQNIL